MARRLVPFADAGDGGHLVLDPRGRVGEYYNEDGLRFDGPPAWRSYITLLEATARSLESGRKVAGWRPKVTQGGELTWESDR